MEEIDVAVFATVFAGNPVQLSVSVSNWQVELHPSLLIIFPSSQASGDSTTPLPQTAHHHVGATVSDQIYSVVSYTPPVNQFDQSL